MGFLKIVIYLSSRLNREGIKGEDINNPIFKALIILSTQIK